MKNTNLTKTIATLLVVLATAFAASAQQTFKVGDKIEFSTSDGKITYTGVITKDEGGGYYSGTIDEPAPMTGNTFFRSAEMLRLHRASAQQQQSARQSDASKNDSAHVQTAANQTSTGCAGNDWSAWGVYKKTEFMNSARERYSTGFTVSTPDLICMVKTRKIGFRLTAAEENELNELRKSPELIAAIRQSYAGGAEKSRPKSGTTSVAVGRYACGKMAGVAGSLRFEARPDIFITGAGSYKNLSSTGAFSYNSAAQNITWKTGALAGKDINGKYEPGVITLYNSKNEILYSCTLAQK